MCSTYLFLDASSTTNISNYGEEVISRLASIESRFYLEVIDMSAAAFPNEDDNYLYADSGIHCGVGGKFIKDTPSHDNDLGWESD